MSAVHYVTELFKSLAISFTVDGSVIPLNTSSIMFTRANLIPFVFTMFTGAGHVSRALETAKGLLESTPKFKKALNPFLGRHISRRRELRVLYFLVFE